MRATFGPFRFDLDTLELTRSGIRLRLEEKPARLLACLIERKGEVVSRDELRRRLWGEDVNLDFEHGLNKAANKLRAALGENATNPQFLETLSRRGYRFIHLVELIPHSPEQSSPENPPVVTASAGKMVESPVTPEVSHQTPASLPEVNAQRSGFRLSLIAAAAGLLVLIPALGMLGHVPRLRLADPVHITLPAGLRLVRPEHVPGLALSPDGSRAAFPVSGVDGRTRICLSDLKSSQAWELPGTEDGQLPFWAPDGNHIGFFTVSELKTIDLSNYLVKELTTVNSARGGSWSARGVILFAPETRGPILRIPADGGTPVPVTTVDKNLHATTDRWPAFLPDGTHFIYVEANHDSPEAHGRVMLASLNGGAPEFLIESDSNAVAGPNYLGFVSNGSLFSLRLNSRKLQPETTAQLVAEDIDCDRGSWYCAFDLNSAGVLYRFGSSVAEKQTLAWFDRAGNRISDYGHPGIYRSVALSPDEKTVALTCGNADERVCLVRPDQSVTQLDSAGLSGGSVWAPDSSAVVFTDHVSDSQYVLKMKPIAQTEPAHTLIISKFNISGIAWHPTGRYLLFVQSRSDGSYEMRILDLKTGDTIPYMQSDSPDVQMAEFSPDGRWIAFSRRSGGSTQILVVSFPIPSTLFPLTSQGGCAPKWRAGGRTIYYLGPHDAVYSLPLTESSGSFRIGNSALLFQPPILSAPWDCISFDVSKDGRRFLVNTIPHSETQLIYRPN